MLTHPDDPNRVGIIHGIWDEMDGSQVKGKDWFYKGNGEWEAEEPELETLMEPEGSAMDSDRDVASNPIPQKQPMANKPLRNVIHMRRESANWTIDGTKNANTKGAVRHQTQGKPSDAAPTQASPPSQTASGSTRRGRRRPKRQP